MIAILNLHLVLHKEKLKQHLKNKISIKHLIKIINLGAINCPVGRNGLILSPPRRTDQNSSMLQKIKIHNFALNRLFIVKIVKKWFIMALRD